MVRFPMQDWQGVNRLRDEMDRLFGDWYRELPGATPFPALNVVEEKETFRVEAELPGMALEDLEILVKGNELTISGTRKPGVEAEEKAVYHRQERGTGGFSRTIRLPVEVDPDHADAKLQHGVLTLTLPKVAEARPRKIEIKTGT
jgi:HSP20 family protein